ncbi:21 kDa protein [Melia azedarach]|uniref:21 kDa protein n=1 Tax=Melia azedarach TaxID=155640 RepID=A0ACC1XI32_MELAZ|nr:21 kDa protein [Melia azedarach]
MKSSRLQFLLLSLLSSTFLLQLHAIHGVDFYPGPTPSAQPPAAAGDTDFIRTSCNATLYPELCYTSLSRYARSVQKDPGQLARVSIGLSLYRVKRMITYVSNLSHQADYGADSRAASALHDCFSNFGDAADEIYGSLKQMRQLRSSSKSSFMFQMSNVQTWMSAALTDEDTCTDGLQDVADGPMKKDICERVERVKKLTSNALALVNRYAEIGMN